MDTHKDYQPLSLSPLPPSLPLSLSLHTHSIEFTVGDQEVKDFRMIERHFFRDKCLKSFDFSFGFCMPTSRNTCEHIYELPELLQSESKSLYSILFKNIMTFKMTLRITICMHHTHNSLILSSSLSLSFFLASLLCLSVSFRGRTYLSSVRDQIRQFLFCEWSTDHAPQSRLCLRYNQ